MNKINIKDIKITLVDTLPGWMILGVHLQTLSWTDFKKPAPENKEKSEGLITYNVQTCEAKIVLWGEFPERTFWISGFDYFFFSEVSYLGLKKLILLFVERTEAAEADADMEQQADAAQDARACELEEEREWLEEYVNMEVK